MIKSNIGRKGERGNGIKAYENMMKNNVTGNK